MGSRYFITVGNKYAFIDISLEESLELILKYEKHDYEIIVYKLNYNDECYKGHYDMIDSAKCELGLGDDERIIWFEYSYYDAFDNIYTHRYLMRNFELEELFRLKPCANKECV